MTDRHPLADALFRSVTQNPQGSTLTNKQLAEAHSLLAHRLEYLSSVLEEIGDYEVDDHASASDLRSMLRYIIRIAHKAVA